MTATSSAFILFLLHCNCCTRSSWGVLDLEKAQRFILSKRQHWCQVILVKSPLLTSAEILPAQQMTGKQAHTGNNDGACFIVNDEQSSEWQQTKGQRTTILHESCGGKADPELRRRWRETSWYIRQIFCQDILKQACLETPHRGPHMCPFIG